MNYKILSFLVLGIFLLSGISAMTVYSDFSDSSQSVTINVNQPISFNADFFSMNPPITSMKVGLYSGNSLIYSFLDSSTSQKTYSNTYTYTTNTAGTYEIRITGTDKVNTDSEYLTLIVNSVPQADTTPPVITILGSNPVTIIQGNSYTDAGAIAIDNVDGIITSEIQTTSNVNVNVVGTYSVIYTVSDNAGNQATATRTVYVVSSIPTNHAPVITSSPVTSVTEGNYYNYNVDATDADNDNLIYSITQGPGWLTINLNTGLISGVAPLVSSSTDYAITIEVSDGNSGIDTQTYTLRVKNYVSGSLSGASRVISDSDIYYQNKYFDQFNPDVTIYSKPITQKILGLDVLIFFYILIFLISVGIVIVVFLLGRNLRR